MKEPMFVCHNVLDILYILMPFCDILYILTFCRNDQVNACIGKHGICKVTVIGSVWRYGPCSGLQDLRLVSVFYCLISQ